MSFGVKDGDMQMACSGQGVRALKGLGRTRPEGHNGFTETRTRIEDRVQFARFAIALVIDDGEQQPCRSADRRSESAAGIRRD
jgi:hypothetical protein